MRLHPPRPGHPPPEGGETDHRNEDAAFDNVAELAAEAIRFGAAEEVAGVHRIADELRSRSIGLGRWKLVDHLDMALRMLACAARRRRPLPCGLRVADISKMSKLADGPMPCTELAVRTDYAEGTVARRLPALRGAGFVVC